MAAVCRHLDALLPQLTQVKTNNPAALDFSIEGMKTARWLVARLCRWPTVSA